MEIIIDNRGIEEKKREIAVTQKIFIILFVT